MKFLHGMLHKTRRIHNDENKETLSVGKLTTDMEKSRLKWFGHLKRMVRGKLPQRM